jgi:hypothetical protein
MFDEYAKQLIDKIPKLKNLIHEDCRRALSKAYLYTLGIKLGLEQNEVNDNEIEEIKILLYKLSRSLQSICVFDKLNGIKIDKEVEEACAFVAAEATSLLIELYKEVPNKENEDALRNIINFLSIESALLYMIGGYDINSITAISKIKIPMFHSNLSNESPVKAYSILLIKNLSELCSGTLSGYKNYIEVNVNNFKITDYQTLTKNIRLQFYEKLNLAICHYMSWLEGNIKLKSEAINILETLREVSVNSGYSNFTEFADIYHLSSLLLITIEKTSKRATVHTIPKPDFSDVLLQKQFVKYLIHRAKGSEGKRGKPFLWPSAMEYITDCLPGPSKNAVISMPTGSGKSFISELAIVNSLDKGWILYLTPTNALASQVRRDLKDSLMEFRGISVQAFIGGDEYTTLSEEQIANSNNYIAVMTPEKCALALRMYPEKFESCSLCVFDECHLMNDDRRGVTVDILLAQLFENAPLMKFVFMSAMIDNAEQLSKWIEFASKKSTVPKLIKWRPSRTMRGLLFLDSDDLKRKYSVAVESFKNLPKSRKKVEFNVDVAMVAGLSGPWTKDGYEDYKAIRLPLQFTASAIKGDIAKYDGWKNTCARQLSQLMSINEIPVINFILTSKHHAFSSAIKAAEKLPDKISDRSEMASILKAWLMISDKELGVETMMWELLSKGIAVHSSGMLQTEQAASEWAFGNGYANLMFATGTLAQGLNFPAVAVIISGTSMGDPREKNEYDEVYGLSRVNALILNGFGRAGRPGFSNQGIGILVSDRPFTAKVSDRLDPKVALESYEILAESDAAITISSPVEHFILNVIEKQVDANYATQSELSLISLLAELNDKDGSAGSVLKRTFAGYKFKEKFTDKLISEIDEVFFNLKNNFLTQKDIPEWVNIVSMKSGVDFFKARDMWFSYKKYGLVDIIKSKQMNLSDWLDIFFSVLSLLPPKRIENYIPEDSLKTKTVLTNIRDLIIDKREIDTIDWNIPNGWSELWIELKELIIAYVNGESYMSIAIKYLGIELSDNNKRSSGSQPIPAVFKFIKEIIEPLAIDAGCFLALNEYGVFSEEDNSVPESLQALPLCIRNGCNSLDSLAWFRFGIRQRISAHTLNSLYPLPSDLSNDSQRANWVRAKRSEWLKGKDLNDDLLNSIKLIILDGSYN